MDKAYQPVHINKWLLPLSWLYGLIVFFRNKFFDWKIFKQKQYNTPIICIGNITVGGTGKTPHTELLVRILSDFHSVAVLSRGYGRKTKGYILSTPQSTSLEIGDEPFQIKQKFPDITVAVDGNRCRGIEHLLQLEHPPEVILLDDAFQHRYVKPSLTILLSDFNRPMYRDTLLPAGRLRESINHASRANIIVVTKCPKDLRPIDHRIISHDINPYPYQDLFFTNFSYQNLVSVFNKNESEKLNFLKGKDILLVTGIASPEMIINMLSEYTTHVEKMTYPDHYTFGSKDLKEIKDRFDAIISDNKLILVTEKDATRFILHDDIDDHLKKAMYSLPIQVSFSAEENEKQFRNKILKHVRENKRNSSIHKK